MAAHRDSRLRGNDTCENGGLQRLELIMDVEHINAIGNSLADLTKRTVDLRGYL
jgi:hypothetical protein